MNSFIKHNYWLPEISATNIIINLIIILLKSKKCLTCTLTTNCSAQIYNCMGLRKINLKWMKIWLNSYQSHDRLIIPSGQYDYKSWNNPKSWWLFEWPVSNISELTKSKRPLKQISTSTVEQKKKMINMYNS